LSWAKILWDCFSQCEPQETWMNFFVNRKRSEFAGRCEDETLGWSKAFLAALSTFSYRGDAHLPWGPNERDRGVIGGEGD